MRKPRPFSHRPIYIDERRERLTEIEQRARRELGLDESKGFIRDDLHGLFSQGQRHVNRRKEKGHSFSTGKTVLIIVLLLLIWILLL